MSTTGLEVFDKTIQVTNTWLGEIMERLGPDRHVAWHVLGAVLRSEALPEDVRKLWPLTNADVKGASAA
jgi:hypothetical protein